MPNKTLSNVVEKTSLLPTDYIVGFTNTAVGGERRWSGTTINTFLQNYIKAQPFVASAWVTFKGTGAAVGANVLIHGSYNVSSVTRLSNFVDTGTGTVGCGWRYQVNFAPETMKNVNYGVIGASLIGFQDPNGDDQIVGMAGGNTLTSCRIGAMDMQARGGNTETSDFISVIFIGGQQ